MPRNSSGVYSKPAGTAPTASEPTSAPAFNTLIDDMVADLNAARPISAGGTGATTASAARAALGISDGSTTTTSFYETRAVAAAASIDDTVMSVIVTGYATKGDGGVAVYTRAASEPSHAGKFQDASGDWWEVYGGAGLFVEVFGAKGDNATDDLAAFTAANAYVAAAGATTIYGRASKTYRVTAAIPMTATGYTLDLQGATLNCVTSSVNGVESNGTSARVTDLTLKNATIAMADAGGGATGYAWHVWRASRIRMENVTVTTGKLFRSWLRTNFTTRTITAGNPGDDNGSDWTGPDVTSATETSMASELNFDVHIVGCRVEGVNGVTDAVGANPAIYLGWAERWSVVDVDMNEVRSGLVWWGGDSNPDRDGGIGSARWCREGFVSRVNVRNATAGGVWGSQGKHIDVDQSYAENCYDYGFHGEGSLYLTFRGCHAKNCRFTFGSYFMEEHVEYVACHGIIDDAATWGTTLFRQNNSQNADGMSVKWSGGSLEMADISTGLGVINCDVGGTVEIIGAELVNVRVDMDHENAGRRIVRDNTFVLKDTFASSFALVQLGRANFSGAGSPAAIVSGNVVDARYTPAAGSRFVEVQTFPDAPIVIERNRDPAFAINGDFILYKQANGEAGTNGHIVRVLNNEFAGPVETKVVCTEVSGRADTSVIIGGNRYYGPAATVFADVDAPQRGLYQAGSEVYVQDGSNASRHIARATASGGAVEGAWSNLTDYDVRDMVSSGGAAWRAIAASGPSNGGAADPASSAYSAATNYAAGDDVTVTTDGDVVAYRAVQANGPATTVVAPGDAAYWTAIWSRVATSIVTFEYISSS